MGRRSYGASTFLCISGRLVDIFLILVCKRHDLYKVINILQILKTFIINVVTDALAIEGITEQLGQLDVNLGEEWTF